MDDEDCPVITYCHPPSVMLPSNLVISQSCIYSTHLGGLLCDRHTVLATKDTIVSLVFSRIPSCCPSLKLFLFPLSCFIFHEGSVVTQQCCLVTDIPHPLLMFCLHIKQTIQSLVSTNDLKELPEIRGDSFQKIKIMTQQVSFQWIIQCLHAYHHDTHYDWLLQMLWAEFLSSIIPHDIHYDTYLKCMFSKMQFSLTDDHTVI